MELLKKLSDTHGISGNEGDVRDIIRKQIKKYVDSITIDKMGNLIAYRKGKDPQIMLASHMDEVGLMVKKILNNGRICLTDIGGVAIDLLIGQKVQILGDKGKVRGVVSHPEVASGKELKKVPPMSSMRVDTGLKKKELEKLGIHIGSYVRFDQKSFTKGNKITGKALDNRIGCYILLEVAKKLKTKNGVYFVFTVQEEMGLYGAKTSAFHIEPDWAIVVDVSQANDSLEEPTLSLGKGPTITAKDGEFIANKCIREWLATVAKKNKIPYQLEVCDEGTTDATNISTTRGGIPSAVLGVAIRNMHSSISIADIIDIRNAIKMLTIGLKNPPISCLV